METYVTSVSDDNMIKNSYTKVFTCLYHSFRNDYIRITGIRITGWMIMNQDYIYSITFKCFYKNLSW